MSLETVSISRIEYTALLLDATSWRLLNRSPHVAEIIAEWVEWDHRRQYREATWAVAQVMHEQAKRGWRWLTYAEVERARRLTSVVPCTGCGQGVELVHPFLDENWNMPRVDCGGCGEGSVA